MGLRERRDGDRGHTGGRHVPRRAGDVRRASLAGAGRRDRLRARRRRRLREGLAPRLPPRPGRGAQGPREGRGRRRRPEGRRARGRELAAHARDRGHRRERRGAPRGPPARRRGALRRVSRLRLGDRGRRRRVGDRDGREDDRAPRRDRPDGQGGRRGRRGHHGRDRDGAPGSRGFGGAGAHDAVGRGRTVHALRARARGHVRRGHGSQGGPGIGVDGRAAESLDRRPGRAARRRGRRPADAREDVERRGDGRGRGRAPRLERDGRLREHVRHPRAGRGFGAHGRRGEVHARPPARHEPRRPLQHRGLRARPGPRRAPVHAEQDAPPDAAPARRGHDRRHGEGPRRRPGRGRRGRPPDGRQRRPRDAPAVGRVPALDVRAVALGPAPVRRERRDRRRGALPRRGRTARDLRDVGRVAGIDRLLPEPHRRARGRHARRSTSR